METITAKVQQAYKAQIKDYDLLELTIEKNFLERRIKDNTAMEWHRTMLEVLEKEIEGRKEE
jgi:hypothetical protein